MTKLTRAEHDEAVLPDAKIDTEIRAAAEAQDANSAMDNPPEQIVSVQMDSLQVDDAISAQGATAPRVSLRNIEDAIDHMSFMNAGEAAAAMGQKVSPNMSLMTLCFITMRNGFVVLGKSAPASAANYDPDKGMYFAKQDAINQLYPLMGYSLRDHLSKGTVGE